MHLKLDGQDWLQVLMAVRHAQKCLSQGPDGTAAWDTQRGTRVIQELTFLIRRNPGAPVVATKIDLSAMDHLFEGAASEPEKPSPQARSARAEDLERLVQEMGTELEAKTAAAGAERLKIFDFLAKLEDRIIALERKRKRVADG